ncbi:hypothetical protein [Rhodococcus opacus]|uniref:Uncharacterized protein n=1 Tax=Rhodococcus opacus TaxID=37919 RepID=A0A2S8JC26_RHOOP|nr:hypothetical protein [Rhodococcus opacus]PQP24503.1 hypothetical protein C5613_13385 [Rhodococcus opacus]
MKNKFAVRSAVVAAVIAPTLVFAGGTPATAAPALSAGGSGQVKIDVPTGESWTCFAFDSNFTFKTGAFAAGIGTLDGFATGSNVTAFCFGNMAPFFFSGSVKVT